MQRKHFISLIGTMAAAKAIALPSVNEESNKNFQFPPYLKQGDIIGITSPAGFITQQDIEPAISKIKEWGFNVAMGNTIGKKDFTFGGTDEERRLDMQAMLDDENIKAILCARGGYGIVRIIDALDFKKFIASPKWIIGFSDITVMHTHIHANYNIATIHSKMCNSFPADWNLAEPIQKDTIESIRQCLLGEKLKYAAAANSNNKLGTATGKLIGGNLKTLESICGSKSEINTDHKILFVEDTGEYLYSIDRMFYNLQRSGKLQKLAGLVVGGFKIKKDDDGEEFGKSLFEIVLEKVKRYRYPVCFDFPVGHQKNNYAVKCGVVHTLSVAESGGTLSEK